MESCYIPNNPQYGLALEYTAYNNGASFNGSIAGFPSGCDPVSDGVLCCSGSLQDCACGGPLGALRDCGGGHCHLNCGDGECGGTLDAINGDLDDCTASLGDCGARLANCDNSLVNCDGRPVENVDPLANCERSLDDSDDRLGVCDNLAESDGHLRECDRRLIDDCNNRLEHDVHLGNCDEGITNCEDRLVDCGDRLEDCDNRITNCDGSLDNCRDRLGDCDDRLGSCDDRLTNCDDRLTNCNGQLGECDNRLTNCDGQLGECDDRLTNCDGQLGECDDRLTNCDGQLGECDDRLTNCDGQLGECDDRLTNCDGQLGECDDRLTNCDGQLGECDDRLTNCGNQLSDCGGRLTNCDGRLGDCDDRLDDCDDRLGECDDRLGFEECRGALGPGQAGPGYWIPDEMASCSFSLPPLDLDPLPSLFPFSPCSGNYRGELKEKQPHEVADVLLSLKHAVVHPGAELGAQYGQQDLALHPQMVMGGPGCYEPCGAGVFPTMSVNVSMNMTMHGYPPDQMCPQMQWGQNPSSSPMNVMYSQNQGVISPAPYPGSATYSFTADFRTPNQSDPLITATSSFKPIQITASNQKCQQSVPNYNIFSQKPIQTSFPSLNPNLVQKQQSYGSPTHCQIKTRSTTKLQLTNDHQMNCSSVGPTYQILGGQNQGHLNAHSLGYPHVSNVVSFQNGHNMVNGGKVQIGSLSGCSGSEDEQKPNLCRICGKTYARPSTLKTHLRTHSGERPYRCSDCNKSFSQAANLTAHVRTHTGQKPFSCQICHRRFSQSSSVTTHMRTHSGERPYRCRACKKAFSDSSTLTKHLRIHSGEKPYQCKLCFLRFSQSGNLNRHMRVHGNNAALLG